MKLDGSVEEFFMLMFAWEVARRQSEGHVL
jgi:hypothetical protein